MQDNESQRQPTDSEDPWETAPDKPEQCFARRLRERREALGWSQARLSRALAELAGMKVDPTAITRMERGDRSVRLNEAVAISTVLGADLDWMISMHPGDLTEQISRAHVGHENALWARQYWENEARRREAWLAELREQHAKDPRWPLESDDPTEGEQ